MRTQTTPAWTRRGTVATLGASILAAGCAATVALPARPLAECLGRADCTRVCIAGEVRRCNEAGLSWERGDGMAGAPSARAAPAGERVRTGDVLVLIADPPPLPRR